jgi:hypothetical protein
MQAACWMRLLRRIPESQHDKLMIVTSVGIEVSIQTVMRAEDDYFVIRGRLAGSTDTGRIFFVPYDQINYLCINRDVPETQIRAMYGDAPPELAAAPMVAPQAQLATPQPQSPAVEAPAASAPVARTAAAAPAPPPREEPEPTESATPQTVDETLDPVPKLNSGIRLTLPRKSGLIQRLRARAQVNNPPPKPPKP